MSTGRSPGESAIAIRQARPTDAAALADLIGELGYPTDEAHVLVRLSRMDLARDVVLIATVDERPVGSGSMHVFPQMHKDAGLAYVATVVVTESLRRRGIGERLMHALEAQAEARGCNRVELASGNRRPEAHRFYERLGYLSVNDRTQHFVRLLEREVDTPL